MEKEFADRLTIRIFTMAPTKRFRLQENGVVKFTHSKFVQRDEFCKLLVGNRKIIRSDVPAKQLRGLVDLATGTRFLIEKDKLLRE